MQLTKSRPEETTALATIDHLMDELAAPFEAEEVKFKPAVVSGNRALAMAYVDARVIQDRLDDVLGVTGWQDEYECLPDGSVVCKLRLKIGDEWITKMDVGGPSEQPDEGDRRKAAFSDALKRAAVKFGIGRYLYRLKSQWVDYDPQRKQFAKPPQLPPGALPKAPPEAMAPRVQVPLLQAPKAPAAREKKPTPAPAPKPTPPEEPAAKPDTARPRGEAPANLPATGVELQQRLYAKDGQMAKQGLCAPGELVKFIVEAGVKAGYEPDLSTWTGDAIILAVEQTKAFTARARPAKGGRKEVA